MFSTEPTYQSVLTFFWVQTPMEGLRQVLVVTVTWIHGCAGLFTWMRLKSWWPNAAMIAYPLAVIIPVAALLGFVEAGNQVVELSANATGNASPPSAEAMAKFQLYTTIKWSVIGGYLALVVIMLAARKVRLLFSKTGIVTLRYLTGDTIRTEGGVSLLEAAELNDLPHANICQGRGRCATCRVRIISSTEELPAPSELETKTLDRFECADNVRLACQLVPMSGTIELERILPPDVDLDALRPPPKQGNIGSGSSVEVAT
jgi:adenylate cyclase